MRRACFFFFTWKFDQDGQAVPVLFQCFVAAPWDVNDSNFPKPFWWNHQRLISPPPIFQIWFLATSRKWNYDVLMALRKFKSNGKQYSFTEKDFLNIFQNWKRKRWERCITAETTSKVTVNRNAASKSWSL